MARDIGPKTAGISPLRLLLIVTGAVFAIELVLMIGLALLPPLPQWIVNTLDASLLVALFFPVFYLLVYRPLVGTIAKLAQANEARRHNEASLRAMLDNLPSMAWLKNAEGRYLAVNEKFARACGDGDAAAVIGKTCADVCPQWMIERFHDDDQAILRSGQQVRHEAKVVEDGQERWYEMYRIPILGEGGGLMGVTGYVRDITAHKQSEEQLRLTAKIFESSHDSIIITDTAGAIISVNPAFTQITGYSAEEVIGKNPRILNSGMQSKEFYGEMWDSILTKGYWNGEVWNRRKDGASYAGRLSIAALRDDTGKVTHYVGAASDITEFKLAQDRVRHLAYYDQLTGLANSSLMRDRVNQLIAASHHERREFALLFIDLDNFKNVNDSLGHHVGDLALQTIAGRLRASVREVDTVARMGGDEFVVVLPEAGAELARAAARKIIGEVTNGFGVDLHKITMTASVGIAVFPKDGGNIDLILKNAELALYQAKRKGKNDYAFFTEQLNVQAFERLRMESELRDALVDDELML